MIVFCEECGARNIIDPEDIKDHSGPFRCSACNDVLRHSLLPSNDTLPPALNEAKGIPTLLALPNLELRLKDHVVVLNQTRPTATMGRQEHNDLEVIDTRVSRSHARIVFRDGLFFLIDHSTNGTFVLINGKKGYNLRRDEIALEGSGIITLGRKVPSDPSKAIHFCFKA